MRLFCKIISVFLLIFASISAFAQERRTAIQNITGTAFIHYYMSYSGVPYYNSDWLKGDVVMKSGEVYHNLQLRYDAFRDDLIYFNNNLRQSIIIDKESIKGFSLQHTNGTEEYFEPLYNPKFNGRYMAILLNDSVSVVVKYFTKTNQFNELRNDGKTAEFLHKETIYYLYNSEIQIVPKRRSAVIKQFAEHKDALHRFCIHNHIRMKNKSDIVLLFSEINRLLKSSSID